MTLAPLDGVRVVDASSGVAGQFCGRMFSTNGADVTLLEPQGGSPIRRMGPFATTPDGALSCLHAHLNVGKRSVAAGSPEAGRLLADAHAVIVDDAASFVARDDVGADAVICEITPFGRDGAFASWKGCELIYQALSGCMFENGSPGRIPLYGVGHRASCGAGVIAYVQTLALLRQPPRANRAVDVSVAEVAASMSFNRATQYAYNETIEGRDARTIPRAIVRCADGWAAVFIYDHRWRESCAALGLPELVDDPRFQTEQSRLAHWDEFVSALELHLGRRRVDDVVAAGQAAKVIVAKSMLPSELAADPQLLARGFWDWSSDEDSLPRLGPMLGFAATPQRDPGPAPGVGVQKTPARPRRVDPLPRPASADGRPLAGVRVLDLTTAWSGPMATRILAALGAEILKVEGPGRIDDWRGPVAGGLPSRYPHGDPGDEPYNRCFQFNTQNHDKRALALDLKDERGREIVLRLAEQADVLIANFSAGTLERMGIGWPVVSALNPRLVLAEMPAYGGGGPMGHFVALGPSMELMCGMAALVGYGDGRPTTTGPAYLDPLGGFNAAAAIVTALAARDRTGVGQQVEVAQREAAMHWIGEEIVYSLAEGSDRLPHGNRRSGYLLHDAFPCAGDDEWIAIAVQGPDELALLARLLGTGTDAPLIAAATRLHDKHRLAGELQSAGIAAAPVCNARDLAQSEFLRDRGLLQTMTHPAAGTHVYQGLPLHVRGLDLRNGAPAPLFGEHTDEVLGERLGLDADELARLRTAGVTAQQPRGARPARPEIAR